MLNQYLAKAARGYISITPLAVWLSAFEIRIKGACDMMEHLADSIPVVKEGTPPMHREHPFLRVIWKEPFVTAGLLGTSSWSLTAP